jgi:AsmA protein
MKRIARVLGIAALILLVMALLLPLLVNAGQFQPLLESKLTQALGREVKLGSLKLSIFSGGLSASDLSIAEDPAFGQTPFVRARSFDAGVELIPLIFSHKLIVTGITIGQPEIHLLESPAGVWNFSSLGSKTDPPGYGPTGSSAGAISNLDVKLVKISGGTVTAGRTGTRSKPLMLEKVDVTVRDFSPASSFPFSFEAAVAGGGTINLNGKAGPLNPSNTAATPVQASLQVAGLDLAASGLLDPSTGIAGLASIDGTAVSNGSTVDLQGTLKAERLKLAKTGTPAKVPVAFDFGVRHDLAKQSGSLTRGGIHLGKATASLTGTYELQGAEPVVNLKLSGSQLALTELAGILPALDVVLPAGSSIDQGTGSVNLNAQGPLDKLVTSGTIGVENARLVNYDLGTKLKILEALSGIKAAPHTEIQKLSAAVHSAPDGTSLQNIDLVVPSIGEITGAGTISPTHALDFKMRVALNASHGLVAALGSTSSVPFTVEGTSANPSFKPDVKGLASDKLKQLTGGKNSVGGLINGLLGGKKSPSSK